MYRFCIASTAIQRIVVPQTNRHDTLAEDLAHAFNDEFEFLFDLAIVSPEALVFDYIDSVHQC